VGVETEAEHKPHMSCRSAQLSKMLAACNAARRGLSFMFAALASRHSRDCRPVQLSKLLATCNTAKRGRILDYCGASLSIADQAMPTDTPKQQQPPPKPQTRMQRTTRFTLHT